LKFVGARLGIETFRTLVAARRAGRTAEELEEAALGRYVPEEHAAIVSAHLDGRPAIFRPESRTPLTSSPLPTPPYAQIVELRIPGPDAPLLGGAISRAP